MTSKALYAQTLAGHTALLGAGHADTLRVKVNLALLIETLGESDVAREMYQSAAEQQEAVCGKQHKLTRFTRALWANNLIKLGDEQGALRVMAVQHDSLYRSVLDCIVLVCGDKCTFAQANRGQGCEVKVALRWQRRRSIAM